MIIMQILYDYYANSVSLLCKYCAEVTSADPDRTLAALKMQEDGSPLHSSVDLLLYI